MLHFLFFSTVLIDGLVCVYCFIVNMEMEEHEYYIRVNVKAKHVFSGIKDKLNMNSKLV